MIKPLALLLLPIFAANLFAQENPVTAASPEQADRQFLQTLEQQETQTMAAVETPQRPLPAPALRPTPAPASQAAPGPAVAMGPSTNLAPAPPPVSEQAAVAPVAETSRRAASEPTKRTTLQKKERDTRPGRVVASSPKPKKSATKVAPQARTVRSPKLAEPMILRGIPVDQPIEEIVVRQRPRERRLLNPFDLAPRNSRTVVVTTTTRGDRDDDEDEDDEDDD